MNYIKYNNNNTNYNIICANYHYFQMSNEKSEKIVKFKTFDLDTEKFSEQYIISITKTIYYDNFKKKSLKHYTIDNNPLFFVKIMLKKLNEAQKNNESYFIMNLPYILEKDVIFEEFFNIIYTHLKDNVPKKYY
jgi:hypothetical protein